MIPILDVSGIGPHLAALLAEKGITTAEQLAATLPTALLEIPGIGPQRAQTLLTAATLALKGDPPKPTKARKPSVPTAIAIADEVETAAVKKAKGKKAKAKKKKLKKKAAAKKAAKKKAAAKKATKKKAAAKKATKKKAKKKAARKKIKGKKNGKSRKK